MTALCVKPCNLNKKDENYFIFSTEIEDENASCIKESKLTGERRKYKRNDLPSVVIGLFSWYNETAVLRWIQTEREGVLPRLKEIQIKDDIT